jgi:hypothetical protein
MEATGIKKRSMSDNPLDKEHDDVKEAKRVAGEYLATIIHMIRREVEVAANAHIATRALTQAIRDVFPEKDAALDAAFRKHYDYENQNGEIAVKARQIVEELDRIFHQAKYGS